MLDAHPLVVKVFGASETAPDVVVLLGFPGPSPRDDHTTRLYLTIDFSEWLDLDDDDIRHSEPPPQDQPFVPTALWVDREAAVEYMAGSSGSNASDFLQGRIMRTHLRSTAGAIGSGPGTPGPLCWYSYRTTP